MREEKKQKKSGKSGNFCVLCYIMIDGQNYPHTNI